jgi:hypothetical protein
MTEWALPPFSSRNRGAYKQIDNDCPETARIGLIHVLHGLDARGYIADWLKVSAELQRLARVRPDFDRNAAAAVAEQLLMELPWDKVFDFCERLYGYLTQDVWRYNRASEEDELVGSKSDIQEYIASELQRLFLEEHLAFEFSAGIVRRRGRRHTADRVARAEVVLGDPRLVKARTHFNKALKYFRNISEPDPENVVKEAVCAVEATARALFPSDGSTLGDVVKSITGSGIGQLPKAIASTFHGLYGFRNGGEGVTHGGAEGGAATKEIAEYGLSVAASQIVLLVDLDAASEPDVPF